MSDEVSKVMKQMGGKGGKATKEKYGKDHFKKLAEKRWAKPKVSCETCEDTKEVLLAPASVVGGDIQDEVYSPCPDCIDKLDQHDDYEPDWIND